ncbi:splicing factor 3A subunit 2 [Tubulinosema ratisbonensis]|uniref:Splicing factor 3A subunit 2 n=1 Tax=Tubulinosema ratisbonensis TaxID=291195 RepID=A0A437AI30_9MICR|nr:splicing factor 3A subunit 2 [Tubulinosema ratisbonensis]
MNEERKGVKKHIKLNKSQYKTKKLEKQKELLIQEHKLVADKYFTINSNGRYECSLCNTVHTTIESFVRHKNGKKHKEKIQINLKPLKNLQHFGKKLIKKSQEGFVIEVNISDFTYPNYFLTKNNGTFILFNFKGYAPFTYFLNYSVNEESFYDFYDRKLKKYFFIAFKK